MWTVYKWQDLPEGYEWGQTVDREPPPFSEPWAAGRPIEEPGPSSKNPPAAGSKEASAKVVESPGLQFIVREIECHEKTVLVTLSSDSSLALPLDEFKDRFEKEEGHKPPAPGN